jgi:hypothetical protein
MFASTTEWSLPGVMLIVEYDTTYDDGSRDMSGLC